LDGKEEKSRPLYDDGCPEGGTMEEVDRIGGTADVVYCPELPEA